jgi:hypothetical protein
MIAGMNVFGAFACGLLLWLAAQSGERSVSGRSVEQPSGRRFELYRDARFEFYGRDYGTAESPQIPALFVMSVRHHRWAEIERVTTHGSKFGFFPFDLGVMVAAPWDFRGLAKMNAVELPLGKGDALHFPSEIRDEGDHYLLLHDTSWKDGRTVTVLKLEKDPLADLFK